MVDINSIESDFKAAKNDQTNRSQIRISDYGFTILQIETILACNMKCTFCAYPLIEKKGMKLSDEAVFDIIDSIDSNDELLEYICFNQYNEPLLDDRIYKFIEHVKRRSIPVKIITNGLLFHSDDVRKKLLESEPTFIKISLETIDKKKFSARGINYSYEKYVNGIFEFIKQAHKNNSATEISIDLACNFLSKWSIYLRSMLGMEKGDLSVPNTTNDLKRGFTGLLNNLNDFEPAFNIDTNKIDDYLKKVNSNYINQQSFPISSKIHFKIKPFIFGRRLNKFYPALKTSKCETRILSVLANGSIVPCCLAYGDMLSMGNIHSKSLPEIVAENEELINKIKKGSRMPEICHKCKGAPTRRGALAISLLRFLKK